MLPLNVVVRVLGGCPRPPIEGLIRPRPPLPRPPPALCCPMVLTVVSLEAMFVRSLGACVLCWFVHDVAMRLTLLGARQVLVPLSVITHTRLEVT